MSCGVPSGVGSDDYFAWDILGLVKYVYACCTFFVHRRQAAVNLTDFPWLQQSILLSLLPLQSPSELYLN